MEDIQTIFSKRIEFLRKRAVEDTVLKGYFYLIYEKKDAFREIIGPDRIDLVVEMKSDAEKFLPIHETLKYIHSSIKGGWSMDSKEPQVYERLSKEEMIKEIEKFPPKYMKM